MSDAISEELLKIAAREECAQAWLAQEKEPVESREKYADNFRTGKGDHTIMMTLAIRILRKQIPTELDKNAALKARIQAAKSKALVSS